MRLKERLEISWIDELFDEDFKLEKVNDSYMIKLIKFANEIGLKGKRIKEIVRIDSTNNTTRYYDFICETPTLLKTEE